MRLFEILLSVSSFALLLGICLLKNTVKWIKVILCAASGIMLAVQLCYEGYRWQMFYIYMITAFIILLASLGYFKRSTEPRVENKSKCAFKFLLLILMISSIVLSCYVPVFNLPKPDGLYKVGTQTFHFIDNDREETFTEDKNDKRELMVQIWYPAQNTESKKHEMLFPDNKQTFKKYKEAYSTELKIPQFVFDYWKYIGSNAFENADIMQSSKPYPLVIICHGMGTSRILHSSQAEELASHGFIVAAIDHTYNTIATAFPDGRVTGYKAELTLNDFYSSTSRVGDIWTEDVNFVINQMEKLNSGGRAVKFKEKIDLNNIGIMGHSFGGATAFNAFYNNKKIKAGIDMDGSLYEMGNKDKIAKPFMFMQSEDSIRQKNKEIMNDELKRGKLSRDKYNQIIERQEKENNIINDTIKHGGYSIYIEGTSHYNFTDLQLFSELLKLTGMTGKIKGKRGAYIVNQYVLDFFNKYLKETEGKLMNGPDSKYPEVKFQ